MPSPPVFPASRLISHKHISMYSTYMTWLLKRGGRAGRPELRRHTSSWLLLQFVSVDLKLLYVCTNSQIESTNVFFSGFVSVGTLQRRLSPAHKKILGVYWLKNKSASGCPLYSTNRIIRRTCREV